jgi:hypothetical protein
MRASLSFTFATAGMLALSACAGTQGDPGPQGPAGALGAQGTQGPQGATGPAYVGPNAAPSLAPWKFAVMSDTQWSATKDTDHKNPNSVATDIIAQLNQEFIAKA